MSGLLRAMALEPRRKCWMACLALGFGIAWFGACGCSSSDGASGHATGGTVARHSGGTASQGGSASAGANSGGAFSTGGSASPGGSASSGGSQIHAIAAGASAFGGTPSTGGVPVTSGGPSTIGGSPVSGGALNCGGSVGTSGDPSTGGAPDTGGQPSTSSTDSSTGGASDTGGNASVAGETSAGGISTTGGSASAAGDTGIGGVPNAGGSASAAGDTSIGGVPNAGGSANTAVGSSTGGVPETGGSISTGGTPNTGGTQSTGGTTGCAPDCAARQCGWDGCNGTCGTCSVGTCSAAGQCVECSDGDTECAPGELTQSRTCSGGHWVTQTCPAYSVCVTGKCTSVCDGRLATESYPSVCFFPINERGFDTVYVSTNDPVRLTENVYAQAEVIDGSSVDKTIGAATSGTTWPYSWTLTSIQDTAYAEFKLSAFTNPVGMVSIYYKARRKYVYSNATNVMTAAYNGTSFIAYGSAAAPSVWSVNSQYVGAPYVQQLNYGSSWNAMALATNVTLSGTTPDYVELNWFMLEIRQ